MPGVEADVRPAIERHVPGAELQQRGEERALGPRGALGAAALARPAQAQIGERGDAHPAASSVPAASVVRKASAHIFASARTRAM